MTGIIVLPNSPFYYFRFYDKYSDVKRKTVPTKVLVTPTDRKIYEQNRTSKEKKKYIGTPELRRVIDTYRRALADKSFEQRTRSRLKYRFTLSEAVNQYLALKINLKPKTITSYKAAIKAFIDEAGDMPLDKYNTAHYGKLIKALRKDEKKETTISIISRSLNVFFAYFVKKKYIQENIITRIKSPDVAPTPILPSDLKIILDELKSKKDFPQHYQIIKFLVLTGMRPSSALAQTWEKINMQLKVMEVTNVKANKIFQFPIYNELEELLKEIGVKKKGKVFPFANVGALDFFRKTIKKLVEPDKPVKDKKYISQYYTLYNLRDTFASDKANSNIGLSNVQELLDHSDMRVTRRHYVQMRTDYLRELLNKK
ncbi:MAG: tyrosine-type recombinase/integrase [bacterium]